MRMALAILSQSAWLACQLSAQVGQGLESRPDPEDEARIAKLIRQLAADDFNLREAAEQALNAEGWRAATALREAIEHEDVEVRQRATRLLPMALESQAVKAGQHYQEEWLRQVKDKWLKALRKGRVCGPLMGVKEFPPMPEGKPEPATAGPPRSMEDLGQSLQSLLEWMNKAQYANGRFDSVRLGAQIPADVEQTALCLLVFLGSGHTEKVGKYAASARAAVAWLRSRQREDGAILNPGFSEVDGVAHALAGLALSEAAGMGRVPGTREAAQKAVTYSTDSHQTRKHDVRHGFGRLAGTDQPDLFCSTLFIMHLKSAKVSGLKVEPDSFVGLIKFLDSVTDENLRMYRFVEEGRISAEATMMGCLSRQFLGWRKEDLAPFVDEAMEEFSGHEDGKAESDSWTTYFATLCMFQQDGERWNRFGDVMKSSFLAQQCNEGEEAGSWNPRGRWQGAGRAYESSIHALCLEVFYRYRLLEK